MGLANTPITERQRIERKIRTLLYKFFKARGNLDERQSLARHIMKLKDELCVRLEESRAWFSSTYENFWRVERVHVGQHATQAYNQFLVDCFAQHNSAFASETRH